MVTKVAEPGGYGENYEYDKMHRLLSQTDAQGNITKYNYNALTDLFLYKTLQTNKMP